MNCGKEMRYIWEAKKWICDECQLSRDAPAPPPPPQIARKLMFSGVAFALAIIGFALIGGIYFEIPAVIIALYAMHRGEGKKAWTALLFSLGCLGATILLSFVFGRAGS